MGSPPSIELSNFSPLAPFSQSQPVSCTAQIWPFLGWTPVPSLVSAYCRPLSVFFIFFPFYFSVWPGSLAHAPADTARVNMAARAAKRIRRVRVVLVVMKLSLLDEWRTNLPHLPAKPPAGKSHRRLRESTSCD